MYQLVKLILVILLIVSCDNTVSKSTASVYSEPKIEFFNSNELENKVVYRINFDLTGIDQKISCSLKSVQNGKVIEHKIFNVKSNVKYEFYFELVNNSFFVQLKNLNDKKNVDEVKINLDSAFFNAQTGIAANKVKKSDPEKAIFYTNFMKSDQVKNYNLLIPKVSDIILSSQINTHVTTYFVSIDF